jgi:hypothetical protein
MPDNPPSQPSRPAAAPQYTPGHVPITEEFDRAKWTLPPMAPVLIAAAVIVVIVAVVAFTNRSTPVMSGSITKVARFDQEGATVVALQVTLDNVIEKQVWIKNIDSELETAEGRKFRDHPAPGVDVARYMKAMPALQAVQGEPLREELKIPAKESFSGVLIFSYPVDQETFDGRKSLTVRIQLYDQPTLVLKQP